MDNNNSENVQGHLPTKTENISVPIALVVFILSAFFLLAVVIISIYGVRGMVSREIAAKKQAKTPVALQEIKYNDSLMLNSTEWIDYQQGKLRIPIKRAMDLIAQENQ